MEAYIHLTGNVGGNVELRDKGVPVASFRLACTPRIRKNGDWADGPTTWLTVTCFRGLATNASSSLRRGDPVVVSGRLRTNTWQREGVDHERTVLEATSIGHDLSWGTSMFRRTPKTASADRDDELGDAIQSAENQPPEPAESAEPGTSAAPETNAA